MGNDIHERVEQAQAVINRLDRQGEETRQEFERLATEISDKLLAGETATALLEQQILKEKEAQGIEAALVKAREQFNTLEPERLAAALEELKQEKIALRQRFEEVKAIAAGCNRDNARQRAGCIIPATPEREAKQVQAKAAAVERNQLFNELAGVDLRINNLERQLAEVS